MYLIAGALSLLLTCVMLQYNQPINIDGLRYIGAAKAFFNQNIHSAITSGTTLTNQTGANETSINCSGGSNSTLTVTFETADMQAVPAGNYTDTVTLEVAPI